LRLGTDSNGSQINGGLSRLELNHSLQHLGQRIDQRQRRYDQLGIDAVSSASSVTWMTLSALPFFTA
jgi:hypothetical protein